MRLPSPEQRLWLEQLVSQSQRDLAASTAAQEYLTKRGFTEAVATQWRLGLVTSPLVGAERYQGRLVIPYLTPSGVVNARFRCLRQHDCKAEGCPKYLGLSGFETNLFNVMDLAKPGRKLVLAEGETDVITWSMCGFPSVGPPGATNWKKWFSRCVDDFDLLYACGDPDAAGEGLNKKLINDVRAIPVRMPKGMDCNDIYRESGAAGLRKLIAG